MRFEIIGKNIEVTDAMKEQIEKKLGRLDKYLLIDDSTIARVVTRVYPQGKQKVEVTIPTKIGVLRTEVVSDDFYAALNLAMDKLEDQLRRQKTRLNRRHKANLAQAFIDESAETEGPEIPVKTKEVNAQVMDLDEAIMQMELSGHDFYIYTDDETRKTSVVYKRNHGGYGLIEVN